MKKFIIIILTAGLSFSLHSSEAAIQRKSQVLGVMKNSKNYIQELQSALEENKQSMSEEAVITTKKDKIRNAMQKELDDLIQDYDRKTSILVSIYGEEILHELNAFNSNEI